MALFKKILIPYDGSDPSKRAAEKGLDFAASEGAEVVGIKIISFIGELIAPSDRLWNVISGDLKEKGNAILSELESIAKNKGVNISTKVLEGSAESEMINCAKEINADLIVMGVGGRSGMGKYLGKTINRVLRESPCPVMVVS